MSEENIPSRSRSPLARPATSSGMPSVEHTVKTDIPKRHSAHQNRLPIVVSPSSVDTEGMDDPGHTQDGTKPYSIGSLERMTPYSQENASKEPQEKDSLAQTNDTIHNTNERLPLYHGKHRTYEDMLDQGVHENDPFNKTAVSRSQEGSLIPIPKQVGKKYRRQRSTLSESALTTRVKPDTNGLLGEDHSEFSGKVRGRHNKVQGKPANSVIQEDLNEIGDGENTIPRNKTGGDNAQNYKRKKKHKRHDTKKSNVSSSTFTMEDSYVKPPDELHGNSEMKPLPKNEDSASLHSTATYVVQEEVAEVQTERALGSRNKEKKRIRHRRTAVDFTIDKRKICDYIENKLNHRSCCKYVVGKNSDCKCGRKQQWHSEKGLRPEPTEWNLEECTKSTKADTFGEISFSGFGQESSSRSPYVRVDHKTKPEVIWNLLDEYWRLPPPKLLISVTGGAKQFFMKNRLLSIFKRGLINAATTTGAWIITGGTNTGVMKYVGEAVRDHMPSTGMVDKNKVVALGIATWGIIENKESLVGEPGQGLFPAHYNADELSTETRNAPIDHNHSHFIFVDNGTEKQFGVEIDFRVMLEDFISTKLETEVSANKCVYIPVVLLVVEGGIGSLKTAAECVDKNIPIVVIQGSGRAADYVALAFKETKPKDPNDDVTKYGPDFDDKQKSRALKLFDWARNMTSHAKSEEAAKCVFNLKRCLAKRRLVTVFHLEDDKLNDIEQAILSALLKANKTNAQSQLDLSMALNRCDIARTEIFKHDNLDCWKKINLYDAMFTALVQNRVDFVQLFLDNGVEPKKFLTISRLHELYKQVLEDQGAGAGTEYLKNYTEDKEAYQTCCYKYKSKFGMSTLLYRIGEAMAALLGDHYPNTYKDDDFLVEIEPSPKAETTCEVISEVQVKPSRSDEIPLTSYRTGGSKSRGSIGDFEHPERELFFWAVLLNRYELAEMFWKSGEDHIGAALTASALFRQLSKHASTDEVIDLSEEYMGYAEKFENLATGVLNECHQNDKGLTQQLLVRQLENWGHTTVLNLADNSQRMNFMQHAACQFKINTVWKGNMALYTSYWKIMLAMVFPFFVPFIRYTHRKKVNTWGELDDDVDGLEDCDETDFNINAPTEPNSNTYGSFKPTRQSTVKGKLRAHASRKAVRKLREVSWTGKSVNQIGMFDALHYFYTAPVTKFLFNIVSYLIFLGLFSYFLLIELCPMDVVNDICQYGSPSLIEYITWGWCGTLILEEIRQVFVREPGAIRYKVKDWFRSIWNRFDLAVYAMFVLSIILRLVLKPADFTWARIMYSLTLAMCFLRFMHMFFVNKNIGPKVIMIKRMLTDLMFFFVILVVFILSYGLLQQALLFPNSKPSWRVLKQVVYEPYWGLYGELFLDTVEGKTEACTTNRTLQGTGDYEPCPKEVWIVPFLLAVYMILTNVLLINLLIAMFSYTFQKVQDNSEKVWRFYRYSLISEYFDRPALAPPLIIFNHILRVIIYSVNCCRKNVDLSTHLKKKLTKDESKVLKAFEKEGVERYFIMKIQESKEHINSRVTSAGERIEKVIDDLEEIKEQVLGSTESQANNDNRQDSVDSTSGTKDMEILNKQISLLQQQMENQQMQFHQMMQLMQQQARGPLPPSGSPHYMEC